MAAPCLPPLTGEGREGVVIMWMGPGIRRHVGDVAVAHAALRDDVIRERLHLGALALEHRHFEAAVVIEMNVERRLREAVLRMEVLGHGI